MHHAVSHGKIEMMKVLIAAGAPLDAKAENDSTPLHWAATHGKLDAIEALVAAGADLDAQSPDKDFDGTPEKLAKKMGEKEASKLLKKLRKKRDAAANKMEV